MTRQVEQQYEARAKRARERTQLLLWMLDSWMREEDMQGMVIDQIVIRNGRDRGDEPLVIVKARFEGRKYVGFHSATDVEAAVQGALERVRNQDMKWREDRPYEPPAE